MTSKENDDDPVNKNIIKSYLHLFMSSIVLILPKAHRLSRIYRGEIFKNATSEENLFSLVKGLTFIAWINDRQSHKLILKDN